MKKIIFSLTALVSINAYSDTNHSIDVDNNKITWTEKAPSETAGYTSPLETVVSINDIAVPIEDFGMYAQSPMADKETIKKAGDLLFIQNSNGSNCDNCSGYNVVHLKGKPAFLGNFQADSLDWSLYKNKSYSIPGVSHSQRRFIRMFYVNDNGNVAFDKKLTCDKEKNKMDADLKVINANYAKSGRKAMADDQFLPILVEGLELTKMCRPEVNKKLLKTIPKVTISTLQEVLNGPESEVSGKENTAVYHGNSKKKDVDAAASSKETANKSK
jgi:hypothetical protein